MELKKKLIISIRVVLLFIGFLWCMLLLSYVLPINKLGITPRTAFGLLGIIFSPFLHAGFLHLVTNSISILILGMIFLNLESKRYINISIYIILFGGIGTWIVGRPNSVHIGASGLIYGVMGFLIFAGVFRKDVKTIIMSIVVFLLYGGAIWGIIPSGSIVSWESHLCGFLAGIFLARYYSKPVS
ncbi:rhomboid family intramembrane serine protease [Spirochaetota bacterium]